MKLKPLILFYVIFHFATLSGQVVEEIDLINTDSIYQQLPQLDGKEKIDTLNKMAFRIVKDFPDSCRQIAIWTIRMSKSLNYQKGLADGYQNMGDSYLVIDSLFPAMINYLNAVRIYEQIGPSLELTLVYRILSLLNSYTDRSESAIKYLKKEVEVLKQIKRFEELYSTYTRIAWAYMRLGKVDSAMFYNEIVLSKADSTIIYECCNLYGLLYQMQFDQSGDTSLLNKSIEWYLNGLNSIEISIHLKAAINNNLHNAFRRFGTKEMDSLALYHLNQVIPIAIKSKDAFYTIPSNHLWRGRFLEGEGKNDSALIFYIKGLEIIDSALSKFSISEYSTIGLAMQDRDFLKRRKSNACYYLYKVYSSLGNHRKALEYYIKYKNAEEDIYQKDNKNLVALLEADFENGQVEKQIALLERDKRINELKAFRSQNIMLAVAALFALLIIIGILFIRQRKIRMEQKNLIQKQMLHHDLELKKVEADKLIELDKMKSRFFANISHEFRTPLTLILGPLEKFKSKISDHESQTDLSVMQRNALRLQKLINQLLSLSKLESGKIKLRLKEEDIVSLSKIYTHSFESLAKQKKIKLEFKSIEKSIKVYLDQDKYEKILYNLISNAFKFTNKGGRIEIKLSTCKVPKSENKNQTIEVTISDTGKGIPSDQLIHIFDRFYQTDYTNNKYQEGTGIGLALVQELAELHHGSISAESELNKGTTFKLVLPLKTDTFHPEDFVSVDELSEKDSDPSITIVGESFSEIVDKSESNEDENEERIESTYDIKPLLLIVEDNADMRYYIRSNISGEFRLTEAEDGKQGYDEAIDKLPDLIISDVMMPKMDGMELCHKLKTDERTSHIPVILLTAKASIEDRLEGLETGADDFLTKPFDQDELLVRIRNLIVQRNRLRDRFTRNAKQLGLSQVLNFPESELNSTDQSFLLKAIESVKVNLNEETFNAESLHKELLMSSSQLYRKLKSLVGMSTSGFIRSVRLNCAAEFLKAKKGNVTEIAFEVGFNNLSYFSKCFEEQFGVLPSEYDA